MWRKIAPPLTPALSPQAGRGGSRRARRRVRTQLSTPWRRMRSFNGINSLRPWRRSSKRLSARLRARGLLLLCMNSKNRSRARNSRRAADQERFRQSCDFQRASANRGPRRSPDPSSGPHPTLSRRREKGLLAGPASAHSAGRMGSPFEHAMTRAVPAFALALALRGIVPARGAVGKRKQKKWMLPIEANVNTF